MTELSLHDAASALAIKLSIFWTLGTIGTFIITASVGCSAFGAVSRRRSALFHPSCSGHSHAPALRRHRPLPSPVDGHGQPPASSADEPEPGARGSVARESTTKLRYKLRSRTRASRSRTRVTPKIMPTVFCPGPKVAQISVSVYNNLPARH